MSWGYVGIVIGCAGEKIVVLEEKRPERRVEGEEGVGEEDRERGNRKRERECVIFLQISKY